MDPIDTANEAHTELADERSLAENPYVLGVAAAFLIVIVTFLLNVLAPIAGSL